jgi:pentatricopeptide repeat protein
VHAQLAARGLACEAHAATALATMYARCRRPADARRVFDRMPTRNRVAWNALVAGHARNGLAEAAADALVRMQEEGGQRPDAATLVSVLPTCRGLRAGFHGLVNVATALLHAYCRCGAVFDSDAGQEMRVLERHDRRLRAEREPHRGAGSVRYNG